jgi:hypothetical protein
MQYNPSINEVNKEVKKYTVDQCCHCGPLPQWWPQAARCHAKQSLFGLCSSTSLPDLFLFFTPQLFFLGAHCILGIANHVGRFGKSLPGDGGAGQ